jgi:hypothetical protein
MMMIMKMMMNFNKLLGMSLEDIVKKLAAFTTTNKLATALLTAVEKMVRARKVVAFVPSG